MTILAAIFAVGAVIWFWSDSLRAREQALRVCGAACRQLEVQFLDQTVAVYKLGLARDPRGRLRLRRFYGFEFSIDGVDRYRGQAVLLGHALELLQMDHPDGPLYQGPAAGKGFTVH
jgi:hypothetical protein